MCGFGLAPSPLTVLPVEGVLSSRELTPRKLADGSVLREKSSAPVCMIFGGAKFWAAGV
jgi:hypothetical protein